MTSTAPEPGRQIWAPSADAAEATVLGRFLTWLSLERGVRMQTYDELWHWSVTDVEAFWAGVWDFFEVRASRPWDRVLEGRAMPGARWFPGARLNYAEHALGRPQDADRLALRGRSQTRPPVDLTFGELSEQVARARAGLLRLGVRPGDRVVAYLPNIPETVIAFLATASLGAVWAACAPELGTRSVVDRFGQLEPGVLLAVSGYAHGDRQVDRSAEVAALRLALPSLRAVVDVPYGGQELPDTLPWLELLDPPAEPAFEQVPADHPLYVLFSSGTTGPPKAIVHGHGGILLEHLKNHGLSWDLQPGDSLMFFTTTSWMVWNAVVSTLLTGATAVLLDGNPLHPDLDEQWRLAAELGVTHLGVSPGYLAACRKAGLQPGRRHDLRRVRQLVAGGAPMPVESFTWVQEQLGPEVMVNLGSGGTDVSTSLVQGGPLLPVWAGEMSARCLGVDAHAFDEDGLPVVDALGELVVVSPMPSMPLGFWDDPDGSRYRSAYFEHYPGIWRHGDWIRFTDRGSCVITGRSDATLNRGGVRLGTAEFYRVVEELEQVQDSLVVHLESPDGGNGELVLYLVPAPGASVDPALCEQIAAVLRTALSPRHVPDTVRAVPAIPRNLTGKKMELPVKRILQGADPEQVLSREALDDPQVLEPFLADARARQAAGASR